MSKSLNDLTPDTRAAAERLLAYAHSLGLEPQITATRRSCAEQNAIYEQGRTTPGAVVTQVAGCRSWHVLGRAVDLWLGDDCGRYAELGAFWKRLGGRWGGDFSFRDCVHFELPHPNIPIAALCPDPQPGACERAVASQPEPSGVSYQTLVMLGAALGASVALAVAAPPMRRRRRLSTPTT